MGVDFRDRRWPGFVNARSLEGIRTEHGPVAPCRLYRSDRSRGSPARTASVLAAEGIRTVVDLRSTHETNGPPGPDVGLPAQVSAPLIDARMDHLRDPSSERSLLDLYCGSIARNGRTIAAAARAILYAADGGVLVHCAAGKDRTGILVAVVLDALGTPIDDIVEDYVRTEANLAPHFAAELATITDDRLHEHTASGQHSTPATMQGLIGELRGTQGGGAAYLHRHGLSPADVAALARRLCDPALPGDGDFHRHG